MASGAMTPTRTRLMTETPVFKPLISPLMPVSKPLIFSSRRLWSFWSSAKPTLEIAFDLDNGEVSPGHNPVRRGFGFGRALGCAGHGVPPLAGRRYRDAMPPSRQAGCFARPQARRVRAFGRSRQGFRRLGTRAVGRFPASKAAYPAIASGLAPPNPLPGRAQASSKCKPLGDGRRRPCPPDTRAQLAGHGAVARLRYGGGE